MIARMIEAVRMLAPLGTPAVSFSQIDPDGAHMIRGSWMWVAKKGASTNRPHMP